MRRTVSRNRSNSQAIHTPPHLNGKINSSPQLEQNMQRRESLIKPTWQHITPGQIPPKTLDKINGITSDDSDEDDRPRRPSVVVYTNTNAGNNTNNSAMTFNSRKESTISFLQSRAFGLVVKNDGPPTTSTTNSKVVNIVSSSSSSCSNSGVSSGTVGGGVSRSSANGSSKNTMANAAVATTNNSAGVASGGVGGAGSGGNIGAGVDICKNTGRTLKRMLSTKTNSNDDEEDYDILGKVILLGDSGVGKTCLLIRFRDGKYMPSYFITTVGIDFRNKVVVVDGTRVKLQIWDTAGQERFRSVTHAYYRDAHALLLLYDVTNKITYDNIRAWLGEIREYAHDDVVIVLIGNKADCSSSERQVKREDGERLAREHNVPFMETSAKTGLNVELAFAAVARQLKSRGHESGDEGKFNVHEFVRDNTRARTICTQCKSM